MKFEENIKEKLADRSINPSVDAWQRVAQKLDKSPRKPKSKIKYWVAIAAGFIGILIMADSLFFDLKNTDGPAVVDTENIEVETEARPAIEKQLKTPQNQSKITQNQSKKQPKTPKNEVKIEQNTIANTQIIDDLPAEDNEVAQIEEQDNTIKVFDAAQRQTIDNEVARLLAQVDSLGNNDAAITDAQVDALLAEAQKELLEDHMFKTPKQNLTATALLQEVEDDLERSFRDKVFDALKEGLTKAREAVASRNN